MESLFLDNFPLIKLLSRINVSAYKSRELKNILQIKTYPLEYGS